MSYLVATVRPFSETRKWIVVRAEAEGETALTAAAAILGDNGCSYRTDAG